MTLNELNVYTRRELNKKLGLNEKAADSDELDGYDGSRYYRSQIGSQVDTDDWNNLTTFGTYKVQNASGANKPPFNYPYGILEVIVAEINGENRLMQRYTPHHSDNYIYERMRNQSSWGSWYKIWRNGTGSGSGLDADKFDGYDSSNFIPTTQRYIHRGLDSTTSISANTWTQVPFNYTHRQVSGTWDNTAHEYIPGIAGYYLITATIGIVSVSTGQRVETRITINGDYGVQTKPCVAFAGTGAATMVTISGTLYSVSYTHLTLPTN